MPYKHVHAPVYGYMKGAKHTLQLHLVHYARTFSIFKLLNNIEFKTVLNIGGAEGYLSYLIENIFNAETMTADIKDERLRCAEHFYGLKTRKANATNLPFKDNSFDVVICIETIEHISDSANVVAELVRVAKNTVIVSTESYFEDEDQKISFLDYIRETHPQFFRKKNPVQTSDVAYFTKDDFKRLFKTDDLKFYPQYKNKRKDIIGEVSDIRAIVKQMTEDICVSKASKVILQFDIGKENHRKFPVDEALILAQIVTKKPSFLLEFDDEMIEEDRETVRQVEKWHAEKQFCMVAHHDTAVSLPIQEEGAVGVSLQWLTSDDLERSPGFCTRRVTIAPAGHTPMRCHQWEHQIFVLSGMGKLIEKSRQTDLSAGSMVQVRPQVSFQLKNAGKEPFIYLDMIPSITYFFGR